MTRDLSELSPDERDLLAVLGLSPAWLTTPEWYRRIRLAAGGAERRSFKADVERFLADGWIERGGRDGSCCRLAPEVFAPIFEDLHARGHGRALTDAFSKEASYGYSETDVLVRVALVREDPDLLAKAVQRSQWSSAYEPGRSPLIRALTPSPPRCWAEQLPERVRSAFIALTLAHAFDDLLPLGDTFVAMVREQSEPSPRGEAALSLALSGEAEGALLLLADAAPVPWTMGARAVVALTQGDWAEARRLFAGVVRGKNGKRKPRALPPELTVFDLLLAVSPVAASADIGGLEDYLDSGRTSMKRWPYAFEAMRALALFRVSGRVSLLDLPRPDHPWVDVLVSALAVRWMGEPLGEFERAVRAAEGAARTLGFQWIARQLEGTRKHTRSDDTLLAALTSARPAWESALSALASAFDGTAAALHNGPGEIFWTIAVREHASLSDGAELSARHVKRPGQQGAAVSVEKLRTSTELPLTAEDRPLVEALVQSKREFRGGRVSFRDLLQAVGHPRLRDESGAPLTVERGECELYVRATDGGTRIAIHPTNFGHSGVAAVVAPNKLTLYARTDAVSRLLTVLGEEGLFVPAEGLPRVTETISHIAPHVRIRGVESLGESAGAQIEPADGRLRVQLFPSGTSFRVRLRVKPAGEDGPTLKPGVEPRHVLVATGARPTSFVRDLEDELALAERLLLGSPYLQSLRSDGDDRVADDLETCLALLTELGPLASDEVVIEWPAGGKLRAPLARDEKSLRVRVGGGAQWLSVAADIVVDETRVLSLSFLLDSISRATGRFVPIGEGEYLALTGKLREQVESLARMKELSDKQGRMSLAALPALTSWADGAEVSYDDGMEGRLDALLRALDGAHRLPRALEAELRDYQRDGFVFLARRASSGFGACLADDMGLGKTVQALALILSRASGGPSVVVAPTSVCRNWEDEARRFAPTLTFVRFAEATDRAACLAALGPRDVLLCSYGLLAPAAELLTKRTFRTAVFDEAHALKNADTRRASAARAVKAEAVVALTGTPLENHLGELHSLFDLLAPGLLGSRERFERAFAIPISRGDRRAMAHLRTLVRPFMLRRTKAQVLEELPEKTEITRTLTPSPAERDFYEAVRRTALQRIERAAKERGAQARIEVLAEITKLRRAAIDPRLVGGDTAPAGTKLDALADLVLELKDEGHRALVYSQFLEVLDRAGALLKERGVRCVRLDGSLTPKARAAAVETFQSGQADVFLLSLKAGGVGMNLTAADYVIHLDPWWNPAVEDQATDRAHRIGQTRPVTVVRLVTEGTIEEKVLGLHASKRTLYEDALSEMDTAKKLDVHALVDLLRDAGPVASAPVERRTRSRTEKVSPPA